MTTPGTLISKKRSPQDQFVITLMNIKKYCEQMERKHPQTVTVLIQITAYELQIISVQQLSKMSPPNKKRKPPGTADKDMC